ncbi:MAG: Slp family lipoprotein [Piscirickettsiaceae bacterium]|nr:Slp family lipoprotein [Piscirickettsiaceae bacterium]
MKKLIVILTILLSGCSTLPPSIQTPPEGNLQLRHVRINDIESFIGEQVRWGGKIINVSRANDLSILEIKQYPLTQYGFPLLNISSQGVFIAQSHQVFDPDNYIEGLLITFSGTINSGVAQVGKSKVRYLPIIDIVDTKLWPHNKLDDGSAYTYTGMESEFQGYGIEGSGHYSTY